MFTFCCFCFCFSLCFNGHVVALAVAVAVDLVSSFWFGVDDTITVATTTLIKNYYAVLFHGL